MIHGFVVVVQTIDAFVDWRFIGMQSRPFFNIPQRSNIERLSRNFRHLDCFCASTALPHSDNRGLPNTSAASVQSFIFVFVGLFAAEVGFIYLYDAPKHG